MSYALHNNLGKKMQYFCLFALTQNSKCSCSSKCLLNIPPSCSVIEKHVAVPTDGLICKCLTGQLASCQVEYLQILIIYLHGIMIIQNHPALNR